MRDVAVIGGGAAGMCFAVMLKQKLNDASVTVYEAADRVLKKVLITGNGRCNIANINLDASRYHGDVDFAKKTLASFGFEAQKEFFYSIGVLFAQEDEGKVYPMSKQAGSVVDALRFAADEYGVELLTNSRVAEIKKTDNGFSVLCNGQKAEYKTVVIACGGKAGGKLGTEDGYTILKSFGHKIEKIFPAIVQLKTETELVRQLKGIKVMANVTLSKDGQSRTEYGELLFTDYGISGPPVLQVSRLARGETATASLDLLPFMLAEDIRLEIIKRCKAHPSRQCAELFTGFLNKRLGQVLLKRCNIDLNGCLSDLTERQICVLAEKIKCWTLNVTGNGGFENAQVTAGGAQASQFFETCMSKKAKGLFAIGEVLDVDGDCGGFNLSFAWASANAAANGVTGFLKGNS